MEYTKVALRGETKRTALAPVGAVKWGSGRITIAVTLICESGHQVDALAVDPEITTPDPISGSILRFSTTGNWQFCDDCTGSTLRSKESQEAGHAELIRILEGAK